MPLSLPSQATASGNAQIPCLGGSPVVFWRQLSALLAEGCGESGRRRSI